MLDEGTSAAVGVCKCDSECLLRLVEVFFCAWRRQMARTDFLPHTAILLTAA